MADLTQHRTSVGWLYAGVVLDAFSRRVIGWAMDERPVTELAVNGLTMAIRNRRPGPGTVHHSDHGVQYIAIAFDRTLQAAGLQGSMGRVGDALDNAVAESFFATLQTELLDRWSWSTRQQLRSAIFDYIEGFCNRQRRHSTLGYLSPAEYEKRWNDLRTSAMLGPVAWKLSQDMVRQARHERWRRSLSVCPELVEGPSVPGPAVLR